MPIAIDKQNQQRSVSAATSKRVSLCLFTYNQREFIHEALQSAFTQDYSPLQIVIVDDGSSDGTAEVIAAETSGYSGPHDLSVLLKERNKGFADSVNAAIYELADGEWLIFAAGDDISSSDRTTKIVAMAMSDPTVTLIESGVSRIDARGMLLGDQLASDLSLETTVEKSALGAAAAYHRTTVSAFPRIDTKVVREDVVLTTRSLLTGNYARLDECLVKWRRHDNNMSGRTGRGFFERLLFTNGKFLNDHSIALAQQMSDVIHAMMRRDIDERRSTWLLLRYANKVRQNQKRSGFFNALAEGKFGIIEFILHHPFYSIYGLTLLLSLYAREKTFSFRQRLTTEGIFGG